MARCRAKMAVCMRAFPMAPWQTGQRPQAKKAANTLAPTQAIAQMRTALSGTRALPVPQRRTAVLLEVPPPVKTRPIVRKI